MYTRGLIEVTLPPCAEVDEDGQCENWFEHIHQVTDSRSPGELTGTVAYLPHSCDQWVIGGIEQIETMIEDLQKAIERIKGGTCES